MVLKSGAVCAAVCAAQPQRAEKKKKHKSKKCVQEIRPPGCQLQSTLAPETAQVLVSKSQLCVNNMKMEAKISKWRKRERERETGAAWLCRTFPFRCVCSILCWMYTCAQRQRRRSRWRLTDERLLAPKAPGSLLGSRVDSPLLITAPLLRHDARLLLIGCAAQTLRVYLCRSERKSRNLFVSVPHGAPPHPPPPSLCACARGCVTQRGVPVL